MHHTYSDPKERREHHQVREVFERCCAVLAPIVAGNANGNSNSNRVSNFGMTRVLMGQFPELSSAEINIVILTVEKMHHDGRLQSLLARNNLSR